MPRKAEALTAEGIAAMIRAARETGAAPRDVADGGGKGLTLRLTPTAATWSMRFRSAGRPLRIRLGEARDWTLAQARSVGGAVRAHVEAGQTVPADTWIALRRAALVSESAVPASTPCGNGPATWTFKEAREAWGAWLRHAVVADRFRPASVRNYLGVMGGPALRTLDAHPVARITAAEVAALVGILVSEHKPSTARDVVRVSKRFWRWMGDADRKHLSGADPDAMAGLRMPEVGAGAKRRDPRLPAIATMLAVAQQGVLSTSVGGAIELLVWTAQSRLSVATARVDAFEPWPERAGWGVWWQGRRTIGQGACALPLPPQVWERIAAYLDRSCREAERRGVPRSEWMYPAGRPRRIGDPVEHLSPDTLTHAVAAMPGVEAAPRDVRRAFATLCQRERAIPAHVVGLALDRAGGDALNRMLSRTAPAMEAWRTAVWAERLRLTLPDRATLKAQIVAENLRQRGVTDPDAEGARRRQAAAQACAEGRTWRQRRRPTAATGATGRA